MAEARVPKELPDMPANLEKEYMQATSESGPSIALMNKYDAKDPKDLARKILQAAEQAKPAKKTKKAMGGMTSTRKRVMKKAMGGSVSTQPSIVRPTPINAGASVPPSQRSTMGMKRGGMAGKKKAKK